MSYKVHICKICSKKEIASGIIEIWIENQELADQALPGQFLHIQCGDSAAMPLRRPISICDVDGDRLRFIFEVKGRGTESLAEQTEFLDILGPLGNSFSLDSAYKKPAIIGGGIGVYPLLYLAKKLNRPAVYLGFRNQSRVTLEEEYKQAAGNFSVSTDDGSYGHHGFAIDCLIEDYKQEAFDIVYACGPKMMLKAVKEFADRQGIKCQLSLEERMGCGIGACLTCSCETPHDGTEKYQRVCKNGPVFWSEEVVL